MLSAEVSLQYIKYPLRNEYSKPEGDSSKHSMILLFNFYYNATMATEYLFKLYKLFAHSHMLLTVCGDPAFERSKVHPVSHPRIIQRVWQPCN